MKIAAFSDVHGNLPALEAALAAIQAEGCEVIVHCGDAFVGGPHPEACLDRLLATPNLYLLMGNHDAWFADGDTFTLGEYTLQIIHTPGHTHGMVTLMLPDNRAIVGDTIFQGGPGKTWAPHYFKVTLETLQNIVLNWPDDTQCFPGHGPSFRLGDERSKIEAFLQREHPDDLRGDVTWDM